MKNMSFFESGGNRCYRYLNEQNEKFRHQFSVPGKVINILYM